MCENKCLVTGANGFIGHAFTDRLRTDRLSFRIVTRNKKMTSNQDHFLVESIDENTNWLGAFDAVTCVVHIAGLAHISSSSNKADLKQKFNSVNTLGTLHLARQAAVSGVKRFVFVSTIGVNGVRNEKPFTVTDTPAPVDMYAQSKLDAEIGLKALSKKTGMDIVIIRPTLVYGPNAPGNFRMLASLAKLKLPLPLGGIHNRRSFLAVDNLVDLIITCINHPRAANQTFLACDDEDVSTSELLAMMIKAAGNTPMLLPVPQSWLKAVAKLVGKQDVVERFCSNLQVDIEHTKSTLNWHPIISVHDAINKCFPKE